MKKSLIITAVAFVAIATLSCCPCRKGTSKPHKPLLQTAWVLQQMEGRNLTAEMKTDQLPRLVLEADGNFGGFGGCNSMGGSYKMTPSEALSQRDISGTMALGGMFATKRYCPDDKVEMEYFALLAKVDSYTIDADRLFLFADGELKLVFKAAE